MIKHRVGRMKMLEENINNFIEISHLHQKMLDRLAAASPNTILDQNV